MRTMSNDLLAFLNTTTQMVQLDLFTFELKNGATLRYSTHGAPVSYGGVTWQPAPAGLTRSRVRWATGIEVDTMDIVFQCGATEVNVTSDPAATNLISDSETFSPNYWGGCAVYGSAISYAGITYREIAKLSVATSESRSTSIGAVFAGETFTATIALRAAQVDPASNSVGIGLYDPTAGTAWGLNTEGNCAIISGPGSVSQHVGALFNIFGLSQTADTVVRVTRAYSTSCTGGFYIYPGTHFSDVVGRSVLATRVQVEAGSTPTSYIKTVSGPVTRPGVTAALASTSILAGAVLGLFDNARVTFSRLFMSDFLTPVGVLDLFQGNAAPAEILRTSLHLTVKSDLERLNVQIPPSVYQPSCMHTLFDIGCAVNPATYRVAGTVTAANANGSIQTGLAQADAYFQMGAIKFTSGANTGLTRTVKAFTGGAAYPSNPFPYQVGVGDAFVITPGCDRKHNGDCLSKYNNVVHFKGMPFIPVPETAA